VASIYKRNYKVGGRRKSARSWTVEFADVTGAYHRVRGFIDKSASTELGRKLDRLTAFRRVGQSPDTTLGRWLETVAPKLRDKLVRWGMLDGRAVASAKPLAEHLAIYKQALLDKGTTPQHAQLTTRRIKAVLDGIKARTLSDVSATAVTRFLAKRRSEGLSVNTSNHHLGAAKAFFNWLVRERMTSENPLAHLAKLQVTQKSRRHIRRALEADEVRILLTVTRDAPTRFGMSGVERCWLYRLAVETGLRASELASLTRESFDLDAVEPSVWLPDDDAKNRQSATLPLRPVTADGLRAFLTDKLPSAQAFRMPNVEHVAEMLRADLADAKIPYRDSAGRVCDFHALRGTFCTLLAAGGVDIKTLQALARHSTPVLTLNTYTHTVRGSEANAVQRLPDFDHPLPRSQRATGTDDHPIMTVNSGQKTGVKTGVKKTPNSATRFINVRTDERVEFDTDGSQLPTSKGNSRESKGMDVSRTDRRRWDSNPRITDLQSVPLVHLGTPPRYVLTHQHAVSIGRIGQKRRCVLRSRYADDTRPDPCLAGPDGPADGSPRWNRAKRNDHRPTMQRRHYSITRYPRNGRESPTQRAGIAHRTPEPGLASPGVICVLHVSSSHARPGP